MGKLVAGVASSLSVLVAGGCGGDAGGESLDEAVTLYTCVSDETIQPMIGAFEEAHPGSSVDLFRAPTGELNARVAADVRSGGLKADVIWTCDPLTMQDYVDEELVGGWSPDNASAITADFRTDDYVGAALLYMVAVHGDESPAPETWQELTGVPYADGVAVPDPSYAASALGTLGYFSQHPDYGLDYYRSLKENGAVQLSTPTEVITGVAEGVYQAGITIEKSAYSAQDEGSPIGVVVPEPGAIAIYSPIALAQESGSQAAKDFMSFVLSEEGQQIVADSGASPAHSEIPSPVLPSGTTKVAPDWQQLSRQTERLLADYQEVFGG